MIGSMLLLLAGAAPVEQADTPADWLRRPSINDMMAVWPIEAMKRGQSGRGVITCDVSLRGALEKCRVIAEKPAGSQFGQAALALAPQFLMKPATRDGKPVAGGTVTIPITFDWRGGPVAPSQTVPVLSGVVWSKAPSYADMAKVFPAKAREQGVGGVVTMACAFVGDGSLKNCETTNESPRSMGFSNAAHALVRNFVGPTAMGDGRSTKEARTQLRFTFPAEMGADSTPLIGKPQWASTPTSDELKGAIPAQATAAGVTRARVVLNCLVVAEGRLDGCDVVSEDPPGLGFSASTLNLSKFFRLTIWTDEGLPSVGGRVRVPIRYDILPPPPAASGAP